MALKLEHAVPRRIGHIGWVTSHQNIILEWRDNEFNFAKVCARAINLALAKAWLDDFLAAVLSVTVEN
ncbi:hypothetical protein [Arthrobacter sp. efr-133-R2A-63]|uniref:hypothetical protein n=1 Tax=Arthrobacter sp. efr-133-R2A-63 TaxID=3040278 RepID=UPI0025501F2A|nr:hypothetical protein [Arthrobacter sp. efr-133-R2A-63]